MSHDSSLLYVTESSATKFACSLLEKNGVSPPNARIIAKALTLADLRGVQSHGLLRLPSYLNRVRLSLLSPSSSPTLTQVTPSVALIDGKNSFGFLSAHLGIHAAIKMAKEYGVGVVGVCGSNHFGMSAWIVQEAVDAGMCSLVFTNSSPALPVYGGREALLGVSPLACGAPGKEAVGEDGLRRRRDFILDMAPSVAARGKVHKALRRGEQIPEGWALDKQGKPTTDPAAALDGGVMLPIGGPKGSALAIMMDVFSGVLTGSAFAGKVNGPYSTSGVADVGHFFVVIKPDLFLSAEEFKRRMGVLWETVVGSEKANGVDRIYFPGEMEQIICEERRKRGIPYVREEIEALNKEARIAGSEELEELGEERSNEQIRAKL